MMRDYEQIREDIAEQAEQDFKNKTKVFITSDPNGFVVNTTSHKSKPTKIQFHKDVCDSIHELYVNKNHDYGDSVHDTYKKYGLVSFLVRMEDKLNRVRTLSKDDVKITDVKVKDEKIEDTLLDLANYAILAYLELNSDKYIQ